jgi:hypothetical protein
MKPFLFIWSLFTVTNCFGQYFDAPGLSARIKERQSAESAYLESRKTSLAYDVTLPIFAAEKLSKTRLNFNLYNINTASINYLNYKDVCDCYLLNPFKKMACKNKLNYLIAAHKQVLLLMQASTTNQINQGVKELIEEKYTHITNTILQELEEMNIDSEEYVLYQLMFSK